MPQSGNLSTLEYRIPEGEEPHGILPGGCYPQEPSPTPYPGEYHGGYELPLQILRDYLMDMPQGGPYGGPLASPVDQPWLYTEYDGNAIPF